MTGSDLLAMDAERAASLCPACRLRPATTCYDGTWMCAEDAEWFRVREAVEAAESFAIDEIDRLTAAEIKEMYES